MIPLQLSLEGIYSYQNRQKIDFENLTDAGLFGIFGAVGSGKSSVLEVITFALFGETERLHSRDKRAYNMMNLKSKRAYIEFDFLNFENKKFRVTREFKRNSKNFDDVKPSSVQYYHWTDENWMPLEITNSGDIEKLIGLSYSNFKRTTIIPQGQFREFIELKEKDRTEMMKEIFNLQQFDLFEKTKSLLGKSNEQLHVLEGQLKTFEAVTPESIQEQEVFLEAEKDFAHHLEIQFVAIETEYVKSKNLKDDFEILQEKKIQFETVKKRKPQIEDLNSRIAEFEKTDKIFSPVILEKGRLLEEHKKITEVQKREAESLETIRFQSEMNAKSLLEVLPKFDKLEDQKVKENELQMIGNILQFQEEIQIINDKISLAKKEAGEAETVLKNIRAEIINTSEKAAHLKSQKLDSDLLFQVGNWFAQNKNLVDTGKNLKLKLKTIQQKIDSAEQELLDLKTNPETYKTDFQKQIKSFETERQKLTGKKIHLEVQQKLSHFADSLQEGKPCLLCGSEQHPHILNAEDNSMALEELNTQLLNTEKTQKAVQEKMNLTGNILDKKQIFQKQLEEEMVQMDSLKKDYKNHQLLFIWKDFDPKNEPQFLEKRDLSAKIEKEADQLELVIIKMQLDYDNQQSSLNDVHGKLQQFLLEEAKKAEQIAGTSANLKMLKFEDFKNETPLKLKERWSVLSRENTEVEKKYTVLSAEKSEIAPKLAAQNSVVVNLKIRMQELTIATEFNNDAISGLIVKYEMDDLVKVDSVLNQKIDVAAEKSKISDFKIHYQTLSNRILELNEKVKDFTFVKEDFLKLEIHFQEADHQLTSIKKEIDKIKNEVSRLQGEYAKKEQLVVQFLAVEKRSDNLKIMSNLFKGAGFVQYVSAMFLRQLCDQANIRFHRMTRNQLSLQLNDHNDFEIIDYLNEGRCRSVKTLSGGQAFQVSLSLALALAETVQTKTATEKNFFFIDEGFGTQDTESVNIVFETLLDLQKENRIVGIISHVEELKEKMPVSLQITKDEEKGSIISYN